MRNTVCLVVMVSAALGVQAEEQTLKEVVVTDTRDEVAERRESSTQKIVLQRKDIENLGVMTIGEVMSKLPGVEISPGGGDGRRARGMSRDSVQILVDGERSAGGGAIMAAVLGRLPSGDLERVEVSRGASAEFGGAASVTVNLIMKKSRPKKSTEFRAGVGRRGSETSGQLALVKNGGEGDFSWTLPVSLMWVNSPSINMTSKHDTTAVPAPSTSENQSGVARMAHYSITPRLTWRDGNDSLTVAPMYMHGPQQATNDTVLSDFTNSAVGVPNGQRLSTQRSSLDMLRLRTEGEKHVGDAKLSGRVALNRGARTSDTFVDAYNAANVSSSSIQHTDSIEHESSMALRLDKPLDAEHLLAVGIEHINLTRAEKQTISGAPASYLAHERQSIAWVQDDWMLQPNVTLTLGVRGEVVSLESTGSAQGKSGLQPSLAVRWEPVDKWVMRSSIGAGLKMPKLDEISNAVTPTVAANTPVVADRRGNPNLRPERSINFEAVLERYLDNDAGVLGVNAYVRTTQDFTERRVQLEGVRWMDRPQNEGNARHWGWELDSKVRTDGYGWNGATVKAHLTLPHARVEDVRLGLVRMARETPKYVMSAGIDQSLTQWQASFGMSMQMSGRSESIIPGEQYAATQARTTFDAFWLYKLMDQINLRVSGQNLLAADSVRDSRFTANGNTWQLHSVDQGIRSIMVALEGRW